MRIIETKSPNGSKFFIDGKSVSYREFRNAVSNCGAGRYEVTSYGARMVYEMVK